MFDLHVVGAGPSGSISAISAIRWRNARVYVSEEHSVAGVPTHCSGLFSVSGLESLKEFVDYRRTAINGMSGAVIELAGEKLEIKAKRDVAFVCDRAKLDAMLALNAEKEGAEINYKERISGAGARGSADPGSGFKSKNIIGADGPNSFVAEYFGFPRIKKFASTLQALVPYSAEETGAGAHSVEIFVSNSKFPGFFGWVIPHNEEEAEIGCGVELPNDVRKAFAELLKLKKIRKTPVPEAAIIPIQTRAKTAMRIDGNGGIGKRNVLLVGDAAGQVKATTGGGVVFGVNCAMIAGRNYDNPGAYESGWRGRFGLDLFLHSVVHDYLAKKSDERLNALGKRLKRAGFEKYLSEKGNMDMPTRMLGWDLLKCFTKAIIR